jgi:hypothetical protein
VAGRLLLGRGGFLRPGTTTESEFDRAVSETEVRRIVGSLADCLRARKEKASFVYGMGGQPRSTYNELSRARGVETIFSRSVLPPGFRVFSRLVASHEGLLRINDPDVLPTVFLKVMSMSMAGIYLFDRTIEQRFVEAVKAGDPEKNYDFGIKDDPGYVIYIVDADNGESPTGIFEIVSYGAAAPWKEF